MTKKIPTEKELRSTSRELLRAYKFALGNPEQKLISTSQFGKVLGRYGRALGGILAGAQKVKHMPILVRQGVTKTSWSGKYESREQLWGLNQKLSVEEQKELRNILNEMNLEIFQIRCPDCANIGVERMKRGVGAAGEKNQIPVNTYRCCSCSYSFTDKDLQDD